MSTTLSWLLQHAQVLEELTWIRTLLCAILFGCLLLSVLFDEHVRLLGLKKGFECWCRCLLALCCTLAQLFNDRQTILSLGVTDKHLRPAWDEVS